MAVWIKVRVEIPARDLATATQALVPPWKIRIKPDVNEVGDHIVTFERPDRLGAQPDPNIERARDMQMQLEVALDAASVTYNIASLSVGEDAEVQRL